MNRKNLTLISRIQSELQDIEQINDKIIEAWDKLKISSDSLYLDSIALNLHGFYSALERIFLTVAKEIDDSVPSGSSWHSELLIQMKTDIKSVRPAVITKKIANELDEYRGFRHIVRNVYSFNLSMHRIEPLVMNLRDLFEDVKIEITAFCEKIEKSSK